MGMTGGELFPGSPSLFHGLAGRLGARNNYLTSWTYRRHQPRQRTSTATTAAKQNSGPRGADTVNCWDHSLDLRCCGRSTASHPAPHGLRRALCRDGRHPPGRTVVPMNRARNISGRMRSRKRAGIQLHLHDREKHFVPHRALAPRDGADWSSACRATPRTLWTGYCRTGACRASEPRMGFVRTATTRRFAPRSILKIRARRTIRNLSA